MFNNIAGIICIWILSVTLIHTKTYTEDVITLLPGVENTMVLTVLSTHPKTYRVNGTTSIDHVIESEGNIGCDARLDVATGSPYSVHNRYFTSSVSNEGAIYFSYQPLSGCDWFFTVTLITSSNSPCNYTISASQRTQGSCCQTTCYLPPTGTPTPTGTLPPTTYPITPTTIVPTTYTNTTQEPTTRVSNTTIIPDRSKYLMSGAKGYYSRWVLTSIFVGLVISQLYK